MVKVGIIGATGYAGGELVRILLRHRDVEIKWYGSRSYIDKKYAEVYQNMFELVEDKCLDDNIEKLADAVDVIFTATPQGYLAGILTEEILNKVKIIDLSADYIDYILYSAGYQQKQTIKKPHGQLKSQPQGNYSYIQIRDMIKRSSA